MKVKASRPGNPANRVAVIATVFNEEQTIADFIESLIKQTRQPDEIIITDGGSTDRTLEILLKLQHQNPLRLIRAISAPGNRSIGRNAAIQASTADIIAVTDAGCINESTWLEYLIKPFASHKPIDVVGGWYQPITRNSFEEAQAMTTVPALSMIDTRTFLPSTRSIAFRKSAWQAVGGFDSHYSHNEDTPFAQALRKKGYHFQFEPRAVVGWYQQPTLRGLWHQFYRYAVGDAQAWSLTSQYPLLFGLTIASLIWIGIAIALRSSTLIIVWGFLGLSYLWLPLFLQRDRRLKWSFLYWVPLTRLTIILATLTGFLDGLRRRIS